jgi:hypothetical protein
MDFLSTWAGVVMMYALAAAIFAYNYFSRAAKRRAINQGKGLEVGRMGRSIVVAGLLMGGSCPLFGEIPPTVPWGAVAAATLFGVVAGVFLSGRITAKWDMALRERGELQPHAVAWWESRWMVLGIMLALLLLSLLLPGVVASTLGTLGDFPATSGFLISGFCIASGFSIIVWARRRAREYGKPITLPLDSR